MPPPKHHTNKAFDIVRTSLTTSLAAGVPTRVVSDRLGHSAMAVTTDIYQHAVPDLEADFAERIAALVVPGAASDRRITGEVDQMSSL
jgi:integrase